MFPFQGLNMRRIFTQIMEVTFARSLNHESSQHTATEVDQQSIAPRIELTSERTERRTEQEQGHSLCLKSPIGSRICRPCAITDHVRPKVDLCPYRPYASCQHHGVTHGTTHQGFATGGVVQRSRHRRHKSAAATHTRREAWHGGLSGLV